VARRRKRWLIGIALSAVAVVIVLFVIAANMVRNFQPMVHDEAVAYLSRRFHCDVQLATLNVHLPKLSKLGVLFRRERGAVALVDGAGLVMRLHDRQDLPPLFFMHKFEFAVDLGALTDKRKTVDSVLIDGLEVNLPPRQKSDQSAAAAPAPPVKAGGPVTSVLIRDVKIADATLSLLPADTAKKPLVFQISHLRLTSVGVGRPMKYDATLTIPKPPGLVRSQGDFGPWETDDPSATPMAGSYTYDHADLGIFNGIAGILTSTGKFDGTLGAVHATGECSVPDFRLKMTGHPVAVWAHFDALVDGTNGNTTLQPVHALLGHTAFTTSGTVIRHGDDKQRTIDLKLNMPNGDVRDLLRLATKGPPFMDGRLDLKSTISIPPLTKKVMDKLMLDGTFQVNDARFLKSNIQSQLDQLSRRGQGQPGNQEIDQVVSNMGGSFRLQNDLMTFRELTFAVPGAFVEMSGDYNMSHDTLAFHGSLALVAKLSEMVTGWKRWILKPVDPFFEKNGAGTYLRIKVDGTTTQPKFGLDRQ
jgi:hypothetical protein